MTNRNFAYRGRDLNSTLGFTIISSISFILTIFAKSWLPQQFLRDDAFYTSRLSSNVVGYKDSFSVVTSFYSFFGLSRNAFILAGVQWIVAVSPLIIFKYKFKNPLKNSYSTSLTIIYLFLIPFYFGIYSKEIIVLVSLLSFLVIYSPLRKSQFNITMMILCLLPLSILRTYYLMILGFSIVVYLPLRKISKKIVWLIPLFISSSLLTMEGLTGILYKLSGVNILTLRYLLVVQSPILANSTIHPAIFRGSFIWNFWNILLAFGNMAFPIKFTNVTLYSFIGVILSTLFIYVLIRSTIWKEHDTGLLTYLRSFTISFIAVALIFEPDVGSFIRHSCPILIVAIFIEALKNNNLIIGNNV